MTTAAVINFLHAEAQWQGTKGDDDFLGLNWKQPPDTSPYPGSISQTILHPAPVFASSVLSRAPASYAS